MDFVITQALKELGINASCIGFDIIKDAINVSYHNKDWNVYNKLCEKYENLETMEICSRISRTIKENWYKKNDLYVELLFRDENLNDNAPQNMIFIKNIADSLKITLIYDHFLTNKKKEENNKKFIGIYNNKSNTNNFYNEVACLVSDELEKVILNNEKTQNLNIEEQIEKELFKYGILSKYKGYSYLKECIYLVYKDPELKDYITKDLYQQVSDKFDTNTSCVERNIRNAVITMSEDKVHQFNIEYLNCQNLNNKITNSIFIINIANMLYQKNKSNNNIFNKQYKRSIKVKKLRL